MGVWQPRHDHILPYIFAMPNGPLPNWPVLKPKTSGIQENPFPNCNTWGRHWFGTKLVGYHRHYPNPNIM
ncbi:hypothetical protein C1H46_038487 [Malus baccata]|uniref:Uncharacterized protein n=1 Tax=Malus baccata TaxID=106549 RepID=A0A540KP65_MALBA|nr:hypothetical protein C1H46_038487 [Malus baccata]